MSEISQKLVLIIDDEDDVRNYLKAALEDAGFRVKTANDGKEGFEEVKNEKPDLISLDLVMPKHSGIKLYQNLQKDKVFKNIPVLIVTGHARDELGKVDFAQMTMQGPGVYLEKPVKPATYVGTVCRLLDLEPPVEYGEAEEDPDVLRNELAKSLQNADPEALKKALNALKK